MLRSSFLSLVLAATLSSAATPPEVRLWQTVRGQRIEASLVKAEGDTVVLQRKNSKQTLTFTRDDLMPTDTVYLDELAKKQQQSESPARGSGTSTAIKPFEPLPVDGSDEVAGEAVKGRLYPRTKDEIRTGLGEILQRDKPKTLDREVHEAMCRLNAYRFLSGVFNDVGTEPEMVEGAAEASKACAEAGTISHSLGHSTDKCNLSMGHHDIASTVDGYMNDGGDNNRERRGHRRWCLNPPMQNAGFGREGTFSAMWCMDGGGQRPREPWSYPGRGLYPLDYVQGNAWSFYMPSSLPPDTKVRIWKLTARPQQSIPWGEEPKGREISVGFTNVFENTVNFEPDQSILGRRGIYWVRVHGRGVREQYLTELF